jgi:hypothetical protein
VWRIERRGTDRMETGQRGKEKDKEMKVGKTWKRKNQEEIKKGVQ